MRDNNLNHIVSIVVNRRNYTHIILRIRVAIINSAIDKIWFVYGYLKTRRIYRGH